MVPKDIPERLINITSIIKNFKSFIKQVDQKHPTQIVHKKKDQNNYFRAEISKKQEQLLRLQVKKMIYF